MDDDFFSDVRLCASPDRSLFPETVSVLATGQLTYQKIQ
jgi:hypothetical protein